jgi:hypothetical protein
MDTSTSSKTHSNTKKRKRSSINTTRKTRSMDNKTRSGNNYSNNLTSLSSSNNKRKRTSIEDKLDELDELYEDIFDDVARNLPESTSVNRNLNNDSSSPENIPNQDIPTPELKILELQSLERHIDNELRRSIRIKSIIANKKEQDDYKIIEELEDNIENTPKESVSNNNTNVDITPKTTLQNLITTGKTPLTDLIINFIQTTENSILKELKIGDISPDYNKKLQRCFDKANIDGIKIRDASCDFIKEENQMKDIWGNTVTDYAKSEKAYCYLCNVKIVERAHPEMEHKIVCPIVFTQFLHYNRLKKLYFTGDNNARSIFMLWSEFKNKNENENSLIELYNLINCSSSNKQYPTDSINTKFNRIFENFKKYIKEEIRINANAYDQFNNEFTFYKSFIKFWLMEFAYAHHTCNQGKHHHPYNTSCGMKTGMTQIAKRSKSKTDDKVTKEDQDVGMKQIVQGTKVRTSYLIKHFEHIIECGNEVCSNYDLISRATDRIDKELATSIFIIKNLRRMYQSTKKRNDNKSKTTKTRKATQKELIVRRKRVEGEI